MFNHLHCHSEYSTLDGFGNPSRWIQRVKELKMNALAMTEHGNIDSSIKMSRICQENGIKFIAGCEFYICRDMSQKCSQSENRHICVYAQNMKGWRNILQMLSEANIRGYHYRARIDAKCLLSHLEGVIISTACVASFCRTDWGDVLLHELIKKIPERLFFEIQPHNFEDQKKWNRKVLSLAEENDIPIIATNDCHYPYPQDAELQEVCLAINSGSDWDDPKRFKFDSDRYFLADKRTMFNWFIENHNYMSKSQIKEALNNTQKIVDLCEDFHIEKIQPDLPLSPSIPIDDLVKQNKNEDDYFQMLVKRGLHEKRSQLIKPISIYRERIKEELDLLISKKFSRYFLMVIDILDFCKEKGIAVGPGRGSVGGCLVAWLTGITQVDPIKYDLLFARFQDPSREDLPDIDLDFEMDRREEVVDYIRSVYGEQNVAQITTFLTMQGKMALQDIGRIFRVPRNEISQVTKYLEDDVLTIEFFRNSEFSEVKEFYHKYTKIVELAISIQGTIRGYGKHAAGVCISNHNLSKGVNGNLARRQGILVSNWDKDEGEYMGLMKLDVLGLTALSRIRVCCEMIEQNHGYRPILEEIDVEDDASLATINRGDCVGIFQLGTPGLTRYCKDLGISSFKDVYNATALFRPGTLRSGMATEFVKRKHGEKYRPIHSKVVPFTRDTEGIILYQEQCMFLFKELAGFDWGKCNKVRKVVAKSKGEEALNVFRQDFVSGCMTISQMSEAAASKVWESIVDFSKYAFNRSHSVEYSIISMWDAWLKTYYPGEFYASCLSYLAEDKRIQIFDEVAERRIRVALPKYHLSDSRYWRYDPQKNTLFMPFSEINGIGEKVAENIKSACTKKKRTFFGNKADLSQIPSSIKSILARVHADDIGWIPKNKDLKEIKDLFKYDLHKILD